MTKASPPTVARLKPLLAGSVITGLLVAIAYSYRSEGIAWILVSPGLDAETKIELVRQTFLDFGAIAPLVYVILVTIEVVVAPLPGLMLYAPGGIVFGGFLGGLLSLVGNVAGAGISCFLMRQLGGPAMERFVERKSLEPLLNRIDDQGVLLIALIRVNPLTSSDLVSYAAGLTTISIWKVMLGTLIGMAPLCWIQAYFADGLLRSVPQLIYPLLVLCAIYFVVALQVIRRLAAPTTDGNENSA